MRTLLVCVALACLADLCHATNAAAQTGFVSGGFLDDIKRYASGTTGPQVYDGDAPGGYLGAGLFITKRFSAELEMALTGDSTNRVSIPLLENASTINFVTTFATRLQTYSALFAVHIRPSARLHLSVRGGATLVHHRRVIVPQPILPASPETNTVSITTTITENVAAPTVGVDADILLSPRFAIVGALRVHRFTVATDLPAVSVRPMVGARVTF